MLGRRGRRLEILIGNDPNPVCPFAIDNNRARGPVLAISARRVLDPRVGEREHRRAATEAHDWIDPRIGVKLPPDHVLARADDKRMRFRVLAA